MSDYGKLVYGKLHFGYEARARTAGPRSPTGPDDRCGHGKHLSLDFCACWNNAAIAAARTMGYGDRHHADEWPEACARRWTSVEIAGTIGFAKVEGIRADPCNGRKSRIGDARAEGVGSRRWTSRDPLEWKNPVRHGGGEFQNCGGEADERRRLLHAQDCTWRILL